MSLTPLRVGKDRGGHHRKRFCPKGAVHSSLRAKQQVSSCGNFGHLLGWTEFDPDQFSLQQLRPKLPCERVRRGYAAAYVRSDRWGDFDDFSHRYGFLLPRRLANEWAGWRWSWRAS